MLGYFPSLCKILGSISITGKRNSNNEGSHTRNRGPKLGMVAFTSLPARRRLREENLEDVWLVRASTSHSFSLKYFGLWSCFLTINMYLEMKTGKVILKKKFPHWKVPRMITCNRNYNKGRERLLIVNNLVLSKSYDLKCCLWRSKVRWCQPGISALGRPGREHCHRLKAG